MFNKSNKIMFLNRIKLSNGMFRFTYVLPNKIRSDFVAGLIVNSIDISNDNIEMLTKIRDFGKWVDIDNEMLHLLFDLY